MGYFSYLTQNQLSINLSVPSVQGVPIGDKALNHNEKLNVPSTVPFISDGVQCVPPIRVHKKTSNNNGLECSRTPRHQEHQKHIITNVGWELFEERAAIMEFEGRFTRAEAEQRAIKECEVIINSRGYYDE